MIHGLSIYIKILMS